MRKDKQFKIRVSESELLQIHKNAKDSGYNDTSKFAMDKLVYSFQVVDLKPNIVKEFDSVEIEKTPPKKAGPNYTGLGF